MKNQRAIKTDKNYPSLKKKQKKKKILYRHTLSYCLYECHGLLVLKEKQIIDLTSSILKLSNAWVSKIGRIAIQSLNLFKQWPTGHGPVATS